MFRQKIQVSLENIEKQQGCFEVLFKTKYNIHFLHLQPVKSGGLCTHFPNIYFYMPQFIKRDIALIRYRHLPLEAYDKAAEKKWVYYPHTISFYWIKIDTSCTHSLATEFYYLLQALQIDELVILGRNNKPWISEATRNRTDDESLLQAIAYFNKLKMSTKFNGAIQVQTPETPEFITHFFTLTQSDSGFYDYYLTDINENLLIHIHYTGRIKILTRNKNILTPLKKAIKNSFFVDAFMAGTDRI